MLAKRLIKSNDAGGGGACTNTVDLYNPFPDGGGVALYQLNGDATDVSGNYNGTASNVTYGAGQFGQAGVFNGTSSYISSATTNAFNLQTFTVSVWAKLNSFDANPVIVSNSGTSETPSGTGWNVAYYNSNNAFYFGNNGVNLTFTTTPILTNVWYHIVATVDLTSNKIKIFLNGVFENENTYNGISYNSGSRSLRIGKVGYFNELYFNGSIDQVRIFSRALRPYEVEALYTEEYCTPTIVPSEHFNTVTYTGAGDVNTITGVGFQPDLIWIKDRSSALNHLLADTVRGISTDSSNTTNLLLSNSTIAQLTNRSEIRNLSSDGFDVTGTGSGSNTTGDDFVAWNFKAGGSAVTNTDGTITSQVSANTEAGFSIVTFTGTSSAATVGHGLSDAPKMIITKTINNVSTWVTYHSSLGNTKYLELNSTNAAATSSGVWNNTSPNDSVFTVGSGYGASNWLAYCFAEVEGFSNFGSYVGNGTTEGPKVITGFEPAFVLVKKATGSIEHWFIVDNKREPFGRNYLRPNDSGAESVYPQPFIEFYKNGFQPRWTTQAINAANETYIYMAFAADPTTIEPSLEDSFNTVTWTGDNTATRNITGVGFQPDLVWYKKRSGVNQQIWADSVRGATKLIYSSLTAAEQTEPIDGYLSNFITDGFSVSQGTRNRDDVNASGQTYVAWNWKGAEIPAINSNGSIPSVVSANPAAGFSIVSYTTPSTNNFTVGHGLSDTPKIMIIKGRSLGSSWTVYSSEIGASNYLQLNSTNGSTASTLPFNNTEPTSSVFTLGSSTVWYGTNANYIAYCFAEVAGFSKFGSYTGTGSNGNFITTGFEPAFLMVKRSNSAENWVIVDNKRGTSNSLFPDLTSQELSNSGAATFSSTGFTVNGASGGWNNASGTYIYMAFANQF